MSWQNTSAEKRAGRVGGDPGDERKMSFESVFVHLDEFMPDAIPDVRYCSTCNSRLPTSLAPRLVSISRSGKKGTGK
jgi:hypothetical protein